MRLHRDVARSPSVPFALLVLGVGVAAPACNWMTFAEDANKTPVRSIGAPSSFNAQDFGASLLPLSNGLGNAAAFVATSLNDTSMVILTIDGSGVVGNSAVPATALDDTEESEITSLVEVPGTSPLRLLLGTPKIHNVGYGRIYKYLLSPMLDGTADKLVVPSLAAEEPGLGRGLGVGRLGGVETTPDYVVASDDRLVVLVDGDPVTATTTVTGTGCDVALDPNQDARYKVRRPLLTARLWADPAGPTVEQLVSGSTHNGMAGKLSFFSVAADRVSLNCLASVSAPAPKTSSRFGASLASGDFNGDGAPDLLVGAPGQEAFIYLGPFPPGGLPTPIAITDPTGVDFGYAIAALNIDGKAGDEALIGDPKAKVDDQDSAGRVTAYAWDAASMSMKPYRTYADHSPEANANFGTTVNALKFCTDTPPLTAGVACAAAARILMVGAGNEVFVYYREGENIPMRNRDGKMIPDVRGP